MHRGLRDCRGRPRPRGLRQLPAGAGPRLAVGGGRAGGGLGPGGGARAGHRLSGPRRGSRTPAVAAAWAPYASVGVSPWAASVGGRGVGPRPGPGSRDWAGARACRAEPGSCGVSRGRCGRAGYGSRSAGAGREAVALPAPSQVHGWRLPGWGRCPAHAPQTPGWPPDLLLPGWLRAGCLTTR